MNNTASDTSFFLGSAPKQNLTEASFTNVFVYGAFLVEGGCMVLGNALLIGVILAYKALRRKEMYIMVGLALGDLLYGTGFFFSGIRRSYLAHQGKHLRKVTPWHCMTALQNPFFIAGSQGAALMLVMLSVDRLLAVRWFAYYKSLGTRYSKTVLCGVFAYSLCTVPVVYFLSYFGTERVLSVPAICISTHVGPAWFSTYQPTVQLSCGILSVLIYIMTWHFYKKQFTSMSQNVQNQHLENQRKLTRTVGITVLFTFFCYVLPHPMIFFFNTFRASKHLAGLISPYGWVLSNINSIANIFILAVHNSNVRRVLKAWMACKKPQFAGGQTISHHHATPGQLQHAINGAKNAGMTAAKARKISVHPNHYRNVDVQVEQNDENQHGNCGLPWASWETPAARPP